MPSAILSTSKSLPSTLVPMEDTWRRDSDKLRTFPLWKYINLSNVWEVGLQLEQCLPQGLVGVVFPDYEHTKYN